MPMRLRSAALAVVLLASSAAAFRVSHGIRSPALAATRTAQLKCVASMEELQKREKRGELERGIGAGRDLPSPSGINTMPTLQQAAITIGIIVAIGAGTALLSGPVFDTVRGSDLWKLSRPTWPILGFIYLAAGIAHFTEADGFENITPPNGTWGWYYTPFSPRVNVLWTGVVEIFGMPRTAWTQLSADCDRCAELVVEECRGWAVGDRLVIAPAADRLQVHAPTRVIANLSHDGSGRGCAVGLNESLGQLHRGSVQSGVPMRAEVHRRTHKKHPHTNREEELLA